MFSMSLLRLFIFLPVVSSVFIISHWSIFVIFALKSLLDNSDIYVILLLVSSNCVFSLSFRSSWFLV